MKFLNNFLSVVDERKFQVLFANTAEGDRLLKVVRESSEEFCITTIQRKYFNEAKGLAIMKQLALPECSANLERLLSTKLVYHSYVIMSLLSSFFLDIIVYHLFLHSFAT